MRPLHWIAVIVGLGAAAWGAKMFFGPPPAADDGSVPAGHASPGSGEEAPKGSQIQLLGGPQTRKDEAEGAALGTVRSAAEVEADRRKEQLAEVLKNLEGAPIYVEGVDGPAEPDPKPPQRR